MFKNFINKLKWCMSAEGRHTIAFVIGFWLLLIRLRIFYTAAEVQEQRLIGKRLKVLRRKYPQSKAAKQAAEISRRCPRPKRYSEEEWLRFLEED